VVNVIAGSPADQAGVLIGDIIFKIDGNALNDASGGLGSLVSGKKPGDSLSLDIWRNGETSNIRVTLSQSPE